MILDDITLQNFRSYTKKTFTFSPQTTLLIGPNTAGKTNILEAIFMLATGKSFRADADRETILWGQSVSRVTCHVSGGDLTKLELVLTSGEVQGQKTPLKKYLVNSVPKRMVDFVGSLRAVLFWPEDLELVTDSPSLRRKYLDSVLVQVDREYRRNLLSYERALRQRNRLLDRIREGRAHRHQLYFWNQLLIAAGGYLTDKRIAFIDFINGYDVSGIRFHIEYDKSVISDSRLEQYKDEEVAAKATLVGPHRDDFEVEKSVNASRLPLSKYGSRGEQRLAVLWLKLAELAFIEKKTGDRPVLLLDDIFSELDEEHRKLVLQTIKKQQTIITSADKKTVPAAAKGKADVIQLGRG